MFVDAMRDAQSRTEKEKGQLQDTIAELKAQVKECNIKLLETEGLRLQIVKLEKDRDAQKQ